MQGFQCVAWWYVLRCQEQSELRFMYGCHHETNHYCTIQKCRKMREQVVLLSHIIIAPSKNAGAGGGLSDTSSLHHPKMREQVVLLSGGGWCYTEGNAISSCCPPRPRTPGLPLSQNKKSILGVI